MGVKFNQHLPWLFDLLDMIPFPIAKHIMPPGALDMVAFTDVSSFHMFDVHRFLTVL